MNTLGLIGVVDSTLDSQPRGSQIDPRTPQQVKIYLYLLTCSPSLTDSKRSNKAKICVAPPGGQVTEQRSQKHVAPSIREKMIFFSWKFNGC